MARLSKDAPLTAYEIFTGFWLSLSLCAILMILPAGVMSIFRDNPNEVKHSVDATLIEAHPYSMSTGKHSSELRWQGRFQLLDGRTIDQPIDGFFYKQFVSKGEQPIKSWISVSGRQLGKQDPSWVAVQNGMFLTAFLGLIGLLVGIMFTCACPHRY
jgi:hypothetical protein